MSSRKINLTYATLYFAPIASSNLVILLISSEADSSSFTAYADIKASDAIAWAKAVLGADQVSAIETGIAAQITEAKTPTVTAGVPW